MYRRAMDSYLQHVMRVRNGVISGADADRDSFELYFNPLITGPKPDPDLALDIVSELVGAAPDDESLAYIAAGPLQSIVVDVGPKVIDRIERLAEKNPRFRQALAAVSLASADPDVASRVKNIRAEAW